MARALGIEVLFRDNLGDGVRGCRHPMLPIVYVARMAYRPRVEWTIAHELAERELREPLEDPEEHERYCQEIASALMMPAVPFMRCGDACGWDLRVLKRWWRHCSWEALAGRIAELRPGFTMASWEGARAKFRRLHPEMEMPAELAELAAFVAAEAVDSGSYSQVEVGGYTARAWSTGDGRAVTICAVKMITAWPS